MPIRFLISILLALAVALLADDKPVPTIEQMQAQITEFKQENERLLKVLSAYQQQFFVCTARAITEKALAQTPQIPAGSLRRLPVNTEAAAAATVTVGVPIQ